MNKLLKTPGGSSPEAQECVIANSETIQVGDLIRYEGGGVADIDATTEDIEGLVTEIINGQGTNLASPIVDTGDFSGTWTSSTKQYIAASDNETVDLVKVRFIPINERTELLMKLDADKDTSATAALGKYYKILASDAGKLDESTIAETETGQQFITSDLNGLGADDEIGVRVVNRQTAV